MYKTLCLALLLTASAAHALTAEESQTLRQAAITAGKQGDDATAFAHWQTLAEAGDAEAQLTLGLLYYQGDGTAQDSTQARAWLEKAAAQGSPEAQYRLGLIYESGIGVTPDDAQAAAWWEKAAAQGNATAQYNLGNFYNDGKGVPKNAAQARKWYKKAAAQTGDKEIQQAAQKALQNLNKTGGKKP